MFKSLMIVMLFSLGGLTAQAADTNADIKKSVESKLPGIEIDSITLIEQAGLYEVVANGQIVYFTKDLGFLVQGEVTSLETRENLTESKRTSIRKQALATIQEKDLIVYEPKKTLHTVTVFTDIDCGYCRKLHQEMAEYNELGIRVRYMAYPRAGIGSESYDKAVSVWCAADKHAAMDRAKSGQELSDATCDNPVSSHYELGGKMGVRGTPALFLESGDVLPGYVPPKRLIGILNERAKLAQF
jgi:thiol:disulfide interchange protein DsbC